MYTVLRFNEYLIREGLAEDIAGLSGVSDASSSGTADENLTLKANKGYETSSKTLAGGSFTPVKTKSLINNDPSTVQKEFQDLPYSKLVHEKNVNEDPKNFFNALANFSRSTGIPMENVMTVFALESGMNTKVVNALGYTGLFQLGKKSIKNYGMTVDQYRNLPGSKQIEYFKKYLQDATFLNGHHNVNSLGNLYIANFFPLALNRKDDYVLGSDVKNLTPQLVAKWNPGFVNSDGVITKADVVNYINKKQQQGYTKQYCFAKDTPKPSPATPPANTPKQPA